MRLRRECSSCGLRYQRERGYFVGGMEFHWLVTFVVPAVGYLALRESIPSLWAWMALAVGLALGTYRHARAAWICVDHLVDPVAGELPKAEDVLGGSRDDCPCDECAARREPVR